MLAYVSHVLKLFLWIELFLLVDCEDLDSAMDALCIQTANVSSFLSCSFDRSQCDFTSHSRNTSLSWVRGNRTSGGPLKFDWQPSTNKTHGSYMYLDVTDPEISLNTVALVSVSVATSVTAVCIEFHYATTGTHGQDIRVYGQTDPGYGSRQTDVLIGEIINVTTGHQWYTAKMFACIKDKKFITLESPKNSVNSTVALDYIRVMSSNTTCDNNFDQERHKGTYSSTQPDLKTYHTQELPIKIKNLWHIVKAVQPQRGRSETMGTTVKIATSNKTLTSGTSSKATISRTTATTSIEASMDTALTTSAIETSTDTVLTKTAVEASKDTVLTKTAVEASKDTAGPITPKSAKKRAKRAGNDQTTRRTTSSSTTKHSTLRTTKHSKLRIFSHSTTKSAINTSATKSTIRPSTTKSTIKPSTTKATIRPSTTKSTIRPSTTKSTIKPSTTKSTIRPSTTKSTISTSTTKSTIRPSTTKSTTKTTNSPSTTKSTTKTTHSPSTTKSTTKTTIMPSTAKTTKTTLRPSTTKSTAKITVSSSTTKTTIIPSTIKLISQSTAKTTMIPPPTKTSVKLTTTNTTILPPMQKTTRGLTAPKTTTITTKTTIPFASKTTATRTSILPTIKETGKTAINHRTTFKPTMAKPVTEITSQSLPESTVSANDITTLHLRITKQTATSRPTIEQETNRYIATTKTSTFSRHGTDSTAPNYTMYSKSVTNDTLLTATSRTSKVIPTDSAAKIHSTNNSSGKTSSILIPVFSTIGGVLLCVGLLVFCLRRHRSPSHFKLMYITDDALVDNEQHEAKYFPL